MNETRTSDMRAGSPAFHGAPIADPPSAGGDAGSATSAVGRDAVFIVGMNGSGTTMLLDCLGRHPELYAFPRETRLIPYLHRTLERFGDLSVDDNYRRLWDEVRGLMVFRSVNGGSDVPLPDDWADGPRDLASVLDRVFAYFAAREGKRRWCEKTPQHVQHVEELADLFPRARFVHVVRDGRDCAASFHRRWGRTPELTMFRWKKVVRDGRRQGGKVGLGRYLEVRYEDLTSEPELWLGRICGFIDVEFDPAVLESTQPYLTNEDRRERAAVGGLRPNSGKWKRYFSAAQIARLEEIGGAALSELGYSADAPDGDRDLSKLDRLRRASRDWIVQYAREIGLKLSGKIDRPWSVILSRPFSALKQRHANKY